MPQSSACPGCGRLVCTQYPFVHQSGRTVRVFCLASCFVRWEREQRWKQHQTSLGSRCVPREPTLSARAVDGHGQMHPE